MENEDERALRLARPTAEDILSDLTEEQLDGIRRRVRAASKVSRQVNSSSMKGAAPSPTTRIPPRTSSTIAGDERMFLEIQSLSNTARALLLARIANVLTVCARDTYEAGTENVLEPQILRAYNELLHRVTGAATGHLLGSKGYSLEDILEMM
jgi:hypothetical protein